MAYQTISLIGTTESPGVLHPAVKSLNIVKSIYDIKDEIISNRRWFHQNPELSLKEFETAKKIASLLREYGLEEVFEGVGGTGVVGLIRGSKSGPCIALRADIDALPIQEMADIPYRSVNPGVMHACGHDGHVAALLAAAKTIFNERSGLKGVVKLIFQPAEEGYNGAGAMISDGVLEEGALGPYVDFIFGNHLRSIEKLGGIHCSVGPVMASSDRFDIRVKGKGGHGAAPQGTVDAIVEAAAVVMGLQTIVSRNLDPIDCGVVTCGMIRGGHGFNIIADEVLIQGTTRAFTKDTQELIRNRMKCICCGVAETYGGDISFEYKYLYPPVINAYPEQVKTVHDAAAIIVGEEASRLFQKGMGSEDFSFFLQERPGCFYFVGAALPGEIRPHHKSVFDFDETALLVSASVHVEVIRRLLAL